MSVNEFDASIRERLAQVQADLTRAREAEDDHGVTVHLGELESLARIAGDHGIQVAGVQEAITGSLPVLDLDAARPQRAAATEGRPG